MAPRLEDLPVELLDLIVTKGSIPKKDFLSLRLVSRRLDDSTLGLFGRQYMSTVEITLENTNRLRRISMNDRLRPYIETLRIIDTPLLRSGTYSCTPTYSEKFAEPWALDEYGLKPLLLKRWPNCRSFVIRVGKRERRIYDQRFLDVTEYLWGIILDANIRVRSFKIDLPMAKSFVCYNIPLRAMTKLPCYSNATLNLKELVVWTELNYATSDWVDQIISTAPNLKRLSIKVDRYSFSGLVFIKHRPPIQFLELVDSCVEPKKLVKLLKSFSGTLQSLSLVDVELHSTSWDWDPVTKRYTEPKKICWGEVFLDLKHLELPAFRRIRIRQLLQRVKCWRETMTVLVFNNVFDDLDEPEMKWSRFTSRALQNITEPFLFVRESQGFAHYDGRHRFRKCNFVGGIPDIALTARNQSDMTRALGQIGSLAVEFGFKDQYKTPVSPVDYINLLSNLLESGSHWA